MRFLSRPGRIPLVPYAWSTQWLYIDTIASMGLRWFTEGFDTPDLVMARALLEELG